MHVYCKVFFTQFINHSLKNIKFQNLLVAHLKKSYNVSIYCNILVFFFLKGEKKM